MKKVQFFFAMFLLSSSMIFANPTSVPLAPENPNGLENDGSRSVNAIPEASLELHTMSVTFPMSTTSQVIIRDAETGAVVYSAPYDATRQLLVDLSTLPEGTYELRLYAFAKWWWGEFELEK